MGSSPDRLIVAVSGASGSLYAVRALEALAGTDIETHLIVSKAARRTLAAETDFEPRHLEDLADVVHPPADIGASIASGSFHTRGMLVVPCSVKTMSEIAYGNTGNLIARAADVVLKERRRLVLAVRESPLHAGHLRSMLALTEMGAVVAPPVPSMYTRPGSVQQIIDQTVARLLDLFGIDVAWARRWGEQAGDGQQQDVSTGAGDRT